MIESYLPSSCSAFGCPECLPLFVAEELSDELFQNSEMLSERNTEQIRIACEVLNGLFFSKQLELS